MEIRRLWTMRGSIVTGADFLSNSQLAAIIITPIITAALSVVGSVCIVFIILFRKQGRSATEAETSGSLEFSKRKSFVRNPRTNRLQTYHRLMLAMSLADIVNSGWIILGPVPNLKETGIVLASGNTTTCAAAGFFFHLGFSVMYYNISLMLYYVMVIRFGMKPQMIARVEPLMHVISIGKPLIESIIGLSYKAFNPWAYTGCYFATYPPLCGKEGGHPCTRGQLASLFYLIFTLGPQLIFVATFHAFIFIIYSSIRTQTRRASQIALTDGHRARKRAVVTQSILYSVIFVNTHVWFFITSLIGIFAKNVVSLNGVLYKLAFLSTVFYPAQVRQTPLARIKKHLELSNKA